MRPKLNTRKARLAYAGAGVSALVIPATAVALTSTPLTNDQGAGDPAAAQNALRANLSPHRLGYGDRLAVTGTASPTAAGQSLLLQFAAAASSSWRSLATATVAPTGRFRLVAPLRQSGLVRVVYAVSAGASAPAGGTPAGAASGAAPAGAAGAVSASTGPGSAPERVQVAASLRVARGTVSVLAGQAVDLRGRLLPGVAGREVRLQARAGGGWRTVAGARTGAAGRFRLHYIAAALGRRQLRVRFVGDRQNARVSRLAGQLAVYRESFASWYDDAGATACGFHAYFGVANRVLPCGTEVTFDNGGRTVTAVVDDRGPFVDGREWDLNQNTAAALGFGGLGSVWSSS